MSVSVVRSTANQIKGPDRQDTSICVNTARTHAGSQVGGCWVGGSAAPLCPPVRVAPHKISFSHGRHIGACAHASACVMLRRGVFKRSDNVAEDEAIIKNHRART